MDRIQIIIEIGSIGKTESNQIVQEEKIQQSFQIRLTFYFKNSLKDRRIEKLKIGKMWSLEECLHQFQLLVSLRQKQLIPTSKISLCISWQRENSKIRKQNHVFCSIRNKIIYTLSQTCPSIVSIEISLSGQCTCYARILGNLSPCQYDMFLDQYLRWKNLKHIILREDIKPKLFKAITLNSYQYLTELTIFSKLKSNKIFWDLSRAQWPCLVRLNLNLFWCAVDGLKVLKKHCFHELQYISFPGDDIGCMKSKYIVQTGVKNVSLIIPLRFPLTQTAQTILSLILEKYVIKTKLKRTPKLVYYEKFSMQSINISQ